MIDWMKAFADAHLGCWPPSAPASLCVSNRKPPHESARNVFKDDETQIAAAAKAHGFVIISPPGAGVVSFVKRP